MNRINRVVLALFILVVALGGCGTPPASNVSTQPSAIATAAPAAQMPATVVPTAPVSATVAPTAPVPATAAPPMPTPDSFIKNVDVGGRSLHILCAGAGSPTVVLDSWLGGDSSDWATVMLQVQRFTRVCAYDRAGLGESDPAPPPRTSKDMVKDLHTLLANAKVAGPYVLVGWSIGGFNVRVYASQYPADVAGMVLVDATHPDEDARLLAALPPPSPNEQADIQDLRKGLSSGQNSEGMDIAASAAQVRASGSLGAMPLVVLTHGQKLWPDFPADVSAKLEQVFSALQNDLASLSSNSSHMIAEQSQHCIPCDQPKRVTAAIRTVVDEVRKK